MEIEETRMTGGGEGGRGGGILPPEKSSDFEGVSFGPVSARAMGYQPSFLLPIIIVQQVLPCRSSSTWYLLFNYL